MARSLLDTMVTMRELATGLVRLSQAHGQSESSPTASALQQSGDIAGSILEEIDGYEATLPGRPISTRAQAKVPVAEPE